MARDVVGRLCPFRGTWALAVFVTGIELRDVVVVVFLHEAEHEHEAREGAHRERTAAEAEQENLVARLPVVRDEAIEDADVLFDARAKGAAGDLVERTAGA